MPTRKIRNPQAKAGHPLGKTSDRPWTEALRKVLHEIGPS